MYFFPYPFFKLCKEIPDSVEIGTIILKKDCSARRGELGNEKLYPVRVCWREDGNVVWGLFLQSLKLTAFNSTAFSYFPYGISVPFQDKLNLFGFFGVVG